MDFAASAISVFWASLNPVGGLPMIATHVGGNVDAIDYGETGILVPPHSPDDLADAILKLSAMPDFRATLGAAAREKALLQFSLKNCIDQYEKLWRGLSERRPGRPSDWLTVHRLGACRPRITGFHLFATGSEDDAACSEQTPLPIIVVLSGGWRCHLFVQRPLDLRTIVGDLVDRSADRKHFQQIILGRLKKLARHLRGRHGIEPFLEMALRQNHRRAFMD
eukprot:gene6693-9046_t